MTDFEFDREWTLEIVALLRRIASELECGEWRVTSMDRSSYGHELFSWSGWRKFFKDGERGSLTLVSSRGEVRVDTDFLTRGLRP